MALATTPNKSTLKLSSILKLNSTPISDSEVNIHVPPSLTPVSPTSSEKGSVLLAALRINSPSSTSSQQHPPLPPSEASSNLQKTSALLSALKIGQPTSEKSLLISDVEEYSALFLREKDHFADWPLACKRVTQQYSPLGQLVRLNFCGQRTTSYYNASFQAMESHLVNLHISYQDISAGSAKSFQGFDQRNRAVNGN